MYTVDTIFYTCGKMDQRIAGARWYYRDMIKKTLKNLIIIQSAKRQEEVDIYNDWYIPALPEYETICQNLTICIYIYGNKRELAKACMFIDFMTRHSRNNIKCWAYSTNVTITNCINTNTGYHVPIYNPITLDCTTDCVFIWYISNFIYYTFVYHEDNSSPIQCVVYLE